MCGLAGTVQGPAEGLLKVASRRGPHGWGVQTPEARLTGAGRYSGEALPKGRPLLAHCRLATDGRYGRAQPVSLNGWTITHNGLVEGVPVTEEVDSLQILRRLDGLEPSPARIRGALAGLGRYAIAMTNWNVVVLARQGLPLWHDGNQWCSRPFDGAQAVKEGQLVVLAPLQALLTPAGLPAVARGTQ